MDDRLPPLRVLIDHGDDGSVVLAEKAVNEYIAAFPLDQQAEALHSPQHAMGPLWRASVDRQTLFIITILEYIDNRMRALERD